MAKSFIERNKRKSALALLLLFLRWRKGTGPLLLVVLLLMLAFIAPSNMMGWMIASLHRMPFGGPQWAEKLSRLTQEHPGDARGFSGLLAALKAARKDSSAAWGLFSRAGAGGRGAGDSLGLVRGGSSDLLAGKGAGAKVKDNASISGVLTPEDAKDREEGVALREEDLQGERAGFVQTAMAGGFAVYAGKNFFSSAERPISAGNTAATALNSQKVPVVANKSVAASGGRLTRAAATQNRLKSQAAANKTPGSGCTAASAAMGNRCALSQLADGRARARSAVDPLCTAKNGCPTEYAAANTGAVYDGNSVGPKGPDALSIPPVPGLDDPNTPGPTIPSGRTLRDYQREGDKIRSDANRCNAAIQNPEYGMNAQRAAFDRVGRDLMALSNRGCQEYGNDTSFFSSLLCVVGLGDCDKRKDCKAMSQAYTADCLRHDSIMAKAHAACPLNSEPYVHKNCHRFDPLGASGLSVPVANPKRIF